MARDNPLTDIERMFDQLSRQFEELDPSRGLSGNVAVDIADTGDAFEVTADLPGYDSDEIDVTLPDSSTLRITATRESTAKAEHESDDGDRRYLRQERHTESMSRTVSLPSRVAEDEATASYDNGVLTVTLPKVTESEGTEIEVS